MSGIPGEIDVRPQMEDGEWTGCWEGYVNGRTSVWSNLTDVCASAQPPDPSVKCPGCDAYNAVLVPDSADNPPGVGPVRQCRDCKTTFKAQPPIGA
jgi:hypothetical protein